MLRRNLHPRKILFTIYWKLDKWVAGGLQETYKHIVLMFSHIGFSSSKPAWLLILGLTLIYITYPNYLTSITDLEKYKIKIRGEHLWATHQQQKGKGLVQNSCFFGLVQNSSFLHILSRINKEILFINFISEM